jgi:hypothetical protein
MSSVAALKALVTVSALGLGAGAVALVVAMQRDPLAFTTAQPAPAAAAAVLEVRPVAPPVNVEPVIPAALTEEEAPAPAPAAPAAKRADRPRKVWARPAPKAAVQEEPVDRVIPAPCVDGQYRKLDENRGVRLMCPGSH